MSAANALANGAPRDAEVVNGPYGRSVRWTKPGGGVVTTAIGNEDWPPKDAPPPAAPPTSAPALSPPPAVVPSPQVTPPAPTTTPTASPSPSLDAIQKVTMPASGGGSSSSGGGISLNVGSGAADPMGIQGSQLGTLRALGRRVPPQESGSLAGIRRIY